MERENLLKTREFWLIQIQNKVFNLIENFRKKNNFKKVEIAAHLGVTKGYISQILNGDYDHKISKLVELSLAFDKAPIITFVDIEKYIQDDKEGKANIENQVPPTNIYLFSSNTKSLIKIDPNIKNQYGKTLEEHLMGSFNSAILSAHAEPFTRYSNYEELI